MVAIRSGVLLYVIPPVTRFESNNLEAMPTSLVTPKPSSATEGFFQARPKLENQFHEDAAFRGVIDFFLPTNIKDAIAEDLTRLGATVLSPKVLAWLANAEAHPPTLHSRDTFGSPRNELITSEGWRRLQAFGLQEGMVASAYEKEFGLYSRSVQFLRMFQWCSSSSTVTCPSAMQDGAAALIKQHLETRPDDDSARTEVLKSAYKRLVSRDPEVAWTSGQWMTERTGGSDVSGTETRARRPSPPELAESSKGLVASDGSPLGPWSIDGFKWFSSATDANMTVLLAKTDSSDRLSLFFAPLRRMRRVAGSIVAQEYQASEFNGVHPQRLKNKLGTKGLPTAELELRGMRAYMLGKEGQGTKEISTVLNITRVYNAVGAVGGLGRGLAVSRAFARVRRALGGRLLMDIPAHVKGMAEQHVDYRGAMMMTYFVAYLLGVAEEDGPIRQGLPLLDSKTQAGNLLRLLTPVVKAKTALTAIDGLRFCMESLGGIGYLENEDIEFNVAKIFRDTIVLSIWEGTTDVMAADTVRVLKGRGGKEALEAMESWIEGIVRRPEARACGLELGALTAESKAIRNMVEQKDANELLYYGRDLLEHINWAVTTALLVTDAARYSDPVALEVAKRWLARKDTSLARSINGRSWSDRAKRDREIVFGLDVSQAKNQSEHKL